MRLFFKKILFFFVPILLMSLVIDYLISVGLRTSDRYAQGETFIWNQILEGDISEDLYIYGSSRAWVHFDPTVIQDSLKISAYNFGIDGHFFWFQHLRHKLLLKNNPKPKVILLSVDVFTLSKYEDIFAINPNDDFYNSKQFSPFILNQEIRQYTSEYKGFSWLDYNMPLFRYYGRTEDVKEALRDKSRPFSDSSFRRKGYRAVGRTWTVDFEKAKSKMEYYEVFKHQPYVDLMHQFLKECTELDIKVIMIYSPEYIEGQEFVKNRDELMNTYTAISNKHRIPFLNYSSDSLCYDQSLFYNSQHLNAKGSKLFSEKLANDLKEYILDKAN
ncbi:hypothetical protein A9Q87_05495 [Flavobacteriales bacterium 34_180_T64]|nr:hypothetical protein A9Q87_05495 [Flavobacteriales bacterium 34_180_T64]